MVFKMESPRSRELISINNKTAIRGLSPLTLTHVQITVRTGSFMQQSSETLTDNLPFKTTFM